MLPDPSTIVPFDPEEFLAAHQYAEMVAENEFLEEIPGFAESWIRMPDGIYRFRKDPFVLFGFAAQRYFRNEPEKLTAFMRRHFGLVSLLEHDEMKPYRKWVDDELALHLAVIEVVATDKLRDGWEFEPKSFFQRVREVAARMDAERSNAREKSREGQRSAKKRNRNR